MEHHVIIARREPCHDGAVLVNVGCRGEFRCRACAILKNKQLQMSNQTSANSNLSPNSYYDREGGAGRTKTSTVFVNLNSAVMLCLLHVFLFAFAVCFF